MYAGNLNLTMIPLILLIIIFLVGLGMIFYGTTKKGRIITVLVIASVFIGIFCLGYFVRCGEDKAYTKDPYDYNRQETDYETDSEYYLRQRAATEEEYLVAKGYTVSVSFGSYSIFDEQFNVEYGSVKGYLYAYNDYNTIHIYYFEDEMVAQTAYDNIDDAYNYTVKGNEIFAGDTSGLFDLS